MKTCSGRLGTLLVHLHARLHALQRFDGLTMTRTRAQDARTIKGAQMQTGGRERADEIYKYLSEHNKGTTMIQIALIQRSEASTGPDFETSVRERGGRDGTLLPGFVYACIACACVRKRWGLMGVGGWGWRGVSGGDDAGTYSCNIHPRREGPGLHQC